MSDPTHYADVTPMPDNAFDYADFLRYINGELTSVSCIPTKWLCETNPSRPSKWVLDILDRAKDV